MDSPLNRNDSISKGDEPYSPPGLPADFTPTNSLFANDKHQLARRLDPVCNPHLIPQLEHGPLLCGFPTRNLFNGAALIVGDMLTLARAGLRVLHRCGAEGEEASLSRYFDIGTPGVRETLMQVFTALYGPEGWGPPEMHDVGQELEVSYDHGPPRWAHLEPPRCRDPSKGAFKATIGMDHPVEYIVLCPNLFTLEYYAGREYLARVKCGNLDDVASIKMVVPGSILLHEFMHWHRLTRTHAGIDIKDWNTYPQVAVIEPPTGYGPYYAQVLAEDLKDPIYNADNFMWFALEAYWSSMCDKKFGEQYEEDEATQRGAEGTDVQLIEESPPPKEVSPPAV